MTDHEKELRLQAYAAIAEQYDHRLKDKNIKAMTDFELTVGMIVEVTEKAIAVVSHANEIVKGEKPCET